MTPWWSVLHFLMQSTTALLLGLLYCSVAPPGQGGQKPSEHPATLSGVPYPSILESDLITALGMTRKALLWIHTMASVDAAAHRAFKLCDNVVRRIAPMLKVDLEDWPRASTLGEEAIHEGNQEDYDSRMEGFGDLVNLEANLI